ncbi:MAG: ABC transporter substrate-binding protein [Bacillota bacterium]
MSRLIIQPVLEVAGVKSLMSFFTKEIDLAYMGIVPFVLGRVYNLPLQMLAVTCVDVGAQVVFIKQGLDKSSDRPIKIGVTYGSTGHLLLHTFLKRNPSIHPRVILVNLSPKEQVKALLNGFLDGAVLWEPFCEYVRQHTTFCEAFSDLDLEGGLLNVLVARTDFINSYQNIILRLIDILADATKQIYERPEYIANLTRPIFGENLDTQRYVQMIQTRFSWERHDVICHSKKVEEQFQKCLQNTFCFLLEADLVPPVLRLDCSDLKPDLSLFTSNSNEPIDEYLKIRIGYSRDIMCLGFHIAEIERGFQRAGFQVININRDLQETIAKLPKQVRTNILSLKELVILDPDRVVQLAGYALESELIDLAKSYNFSTDTIGLASLINTLYKNGFLPRTVSTLCHSLRELRNLASHPDRDNPNFRSDLSPIQAQHALEMLVDFYLWRYELQQATSVCPKCHQKLRSNWILCPYCGMSMENG